MARELDLLNDSAVEVVSVQRDGPAGDARVVPEDLIVALNGRVVTNVDDLHRLLVTFRTSTSLVLTLVRGKQKLELQIDPTLST